MLVRNGGQAASGLLGLAKARKKVVLIKRPSLLRVFSSYSGELIRVYVLLKPLGLLVS